MTLPGWLGALITGIVEEDDRERAEALTAFYQSQRGKPGKPNKGGGASDVTPPTVTITCAQTSPTGVSPLNFTFTFSESVIGFAVDDITVGNGTAGNFAGSGAVYTCDVTPSGIGSVTVDVAQGVCVDASGNGNIAATQFVIFYTSLLSGLQVAYDFHETSGDFQNLHTAGGSHPIPRNVVDQITGYFGKALWGMDHTGGTWDTTNKKHIGLSTTDSLFNNDTSQSYTFAVLASPHNFSVGGGKIFAKTSGSLYEYQLTCDATTFTFKMGDGITESGVDIRCGVTAWWGFVQLVVCYYDASRHVIGISLTNETPQEADVSGITIQHVNNSVFNALTWNDNAAANQCSACHFLARWNRVLTTAEIASLYNGAKYRNYPFADETVDKSFKLIFDGDSWTQREMYPLTILGLYGRGHPYANFGNSGDHIPDLIARSAATDAAYDATCTKNILCVMAGINDIANNVSAATAYADLQTYCSGRRSAGYKVVVFTVHTVGTLTGLQETARLAYNALIVANWETFADGLCDAGSDATFDTPTDQIYYIEDAIHLTNKGDAYLAGLAKTAIDVVLAA